MSYHRFYIHAPEGANAVYILDRAYAHQVVRRYIGKKRRIVATAELLLLNARDVAETLA